MKTIKKIAEKYQVSEETAQALLMGLKVTGGRQVQFNIGELGGMGQWQPGMIMVGDMFDIGLKYKVDGLCTELSELVRSEEETPKTPTKTTSKTKSPPKTESTTTKSSASFRGSQNGYHYAYFSSEDKLEIEYEGKITKYSTKGYPLSGVQQSQSNSAQNLTFSYPGGTVSVKDLKKIK